MQEAITDVGDCFRDLLSDRTDLQETIVELENQLNEYGWLLLSHNPSELDFSREGLDNIIKLSRLFWIKNPTIKHAVEIQNLYVWAQGWSIKAPDATIDEVVQAFIADRANQATISSYVARKALERTRRVDGNVFFVFFVNPDTGRVVVRTIRVDEVREVIRNPQDRTEVRFYKRIWRDAGSEAKLGGEHVAYYPDWRYLRECEIAEESPSAAGLPEGATVLWDNPVYHLKAEHLDGMDFGIPETYVSLDWARAHKECLEDFKKTVKALSKWAWTLKGGGGQAAVDAAVSKLNTMLASFSSDLSTQVPQCGKTFVGGKDVEIEAVDVSNAYVPTDTFRPLLRNAGIGMGLPETIASGDVSSGNQATATTLDRPTELQFLDCQIMWGETFVDLCTIALEYAAKAPGRSTVRFRGYDATTGEMLLGDGVATGRLGRFVNVDFPPILQRDVAEWISAFVRLITLGNWPIQILDDVPTILRLGLTALRVDNVEEIIEKFYPADGSEAKGLHPVPPFAPRQRAVGASQLGRGDDPDGGSPAKPYGTAPTSSASQREAVMEAEDDAAARDLARKVAELRAAILASTETPA